MYADDTRQSHNSRRAFQKKMSNVSVHIFLVLVSLQMACHSSFSFVRSFLIGLSCITANTYNTWIRVDSVVQW